MAESAYFNYLENLKSNFLFVKHNADKLLGENKSIRFTDTPIVDIVGIAKKVGITEIKPVPSVKIDDEHARLKGTVILVNENDSLEERRFSIAHEIYHFISCAEKEQLEAARSNLNFEIIKDKDVLIDDNNQKFVVHAQNEIGRIILETVGKPISNRTKNIIFGKIGAFILKITGENRNKNVLLSDVLADIFAAIKKIIIDAINEEIADYFAANLLVPTERFILWEDKPDDEIARAFGVNTGCIRKRRNEEIDYELRFMVPENLSSDVKANEITPLSHDELDHILEGSTTNAHR